MGSTLAPGNGYMEKEKVVAKAQTILARVVVVQVIMAREAMEVRLGMNITVGSLEERVAPRMEVQPICQQILAPAARAVRVVVVLHH